MQVMGGISNMALWLRMPLTSLTNPSSAVHSTLSAAPTGGPQSAGSSQPAMANGHHSSQESMQQSQAGKSLLGQVSAAFHLWVCLAQQPTKQFVSITFSELQSGAKSNQQ